ncbi:hypothetical protein KAH81_07025 [bacterium]|nr:hypothetical protein [bacterium]
MFSGFALAGLFFSVGAELLFPRFSNSFIEKAIHLLTPAVVMGLVGLLFSPRLLKKKRSSVFSYILFALTGLAGVLLLLSYFETGSQFDLTLKSYYIGCWFGVFFGFATCFAIDEAIYRKEENENRE